MAQAKRYVTPKMLRFLREIAENNNREWFTENKERYFEEVRDPLLDLIADVGPRLAKISPRIVADPRPVGGSLFRIYRDTRFSRDKRPYKTYAGMSFRHAEGRDTPAPGFYLHIEPGGVFTAAGMWHPASETAKQVRDAIVANPERWKRATRARGRALDEGGERLKRPPRGFDPEHPLVDDLKRKGFTMSRSFTQKEASSPEFLSEFANSCRRAAPLMEFLTNAVGLKW